jgi:hypothetical protein
VLACRYMCTVSGGRNGAKLHCGYRRKGESRTVAGGEGMHHCEPMRGEDEEGADGWGCAVSEKRGGHNVGTWARGRGLQMGLSGEGKRAEGVVRERASWLKPA